jgi:hypothetical protein
MAFVAGAAGGSLWATSWRTWFYGAGLWVKLALGAVISVGLVLPAMMGAVWPRLWLIAPESLIFRFRSRGISVVSVKFCKSGSVVRGFGEIKRFMGRV